MTKCKCKVLWCVFILFPLFIKGGVWLLNGKNSCDYYCNLCCMFYILGYWCGSIRPKRLVFNVRVRANNGRTDIEGMVLCNY